MCELVVEGWIVAGIWMLGVESGYVDVRFAWKKGAVVCF